MDRTHGMDHYDPDDCFGCKVLTVGVQPSAMPSRHPDASWRRSAEVDLSRDLTSFANMRKAGLHPKSTRGAAVLESQAESTFEVESGQLAHQKAKGRDAASNKVSQRGKEWRRRTDEAFTEARKGNVIECA